jgi:hypothetical protein
MFSRKLSNNALLHGPNSFLLAFSGAFYYVKMSAFTPKLQYTLHPLLEVLLSQNRSMLSSYHSFHNIAISKGLTRVGEYDFQTDIKVLTTRARDGHFSFSGDATQLFYFERKAAVVSISSDGLALPQIYVSGEEALFKHGPLQVCRACRLTQIIRRARPTLEDECPQTVSTVAILESQSGLGCRQC